MFKYRWVATYKNGSELCQYNGKTEHLFKEINQKELKLFFLQSKDKLFGVNLENGIFTVNGEEFGIQGLINLKEKYRLIYHRQITEIMVGRERGKEIEYHFGFQSTRQGRNNHIIIEIKPDDKFVLDIKL